MDSLGRTVLSGVRVDLEVFYTPGEGGRGWGVRAGEYLAKGAFVALYAGELSWAKIPVDGNKINDLKDEGETGRGSRRYRMELKEEEEEEGGAGEGMRYRMEFPDRENKAGDSFLVLDAQRVGNVARFINNSAGEGEATLRK